MISTLGNQHKLGILFLAAANYPACASKVKLGTMKGSKKLILASYISANIGTGGNLIGKSFKNGGGIIKLNEQDASTGYSTHSANEPVS